MPRLALALVALMAACHREDPHPSAASSSVPIAPSSSSPSSSSSSPPPLPVTACPSDMRLIQGTYCPTPEQICLEWNTVNVAGVTEKQQCKHYKKPSRCISKERMPMRFCMDTYEWPNQKGEIPWDLTSWQEAKDKCESIGKRLCSDVEHTYACEGDEMKPHVTGWDRDPEKCSFDRPYRLRTFNFLKREPCAQDEKCKAALVEIDQRVPSGSMPECVSNDGVYDLNGNVNEWVELPGRPFSKRAGLKGGWWGPVRDRCRPITTFHGESDFGYEVGFRCCKDATGEASVR